jgi:hypothetical protein
VQHGKNKLKTRWISQYFTSRVYVNFSRVHSILTHSTKQNRQRERTIITNPSLHPRPTINPSLPRSSVQPAAATSDPTEAFNRVFFVNIPIVLSRAGRAPRMTCFDWARQPRVLSINQSLGDERENRRGMVEKGRTVELRRTAESLRSVSRCPGCGTRIIIAYTLSNQLIFAAHPHRLPPSPNTKSTGEREREKLADVLPDGVHRM